MIVLRIIILCPSALLDRPAFKDLVGKGERGNQKLDGLYFNLDFNLKELNLPFVS